jgi:hypothetical protein
MERITPKSRRRTLRPLANLALPDTACLIVTEAGLDRAARGGTGAVPAESSNGTLAAHAAAGNTAPEVPFWDGEKSLWWGRQVIKRLRRSAKCQRLILAAFEEVGWLQHIDDPLLRDNRIDPKERLRQTVRHLKERHLAALISFWEDDAGRGICWGLL